MRNMDGRPRLTLLSGPTEVAFKDTRLHLKLFLDADDIEALGVGPGLNVRVRVVVETEAGEPVLSIVSGPRAGQPILEQNEFDVTLSVHNELYLGYIRLREVSRNHGGALFRLRASLPMQPSVASAVTEAFVVRSERVRAPSYALQLANARKRSAAAHSDESDTNSDRRYRGRNVRPASAPAAAAAAAAPPTPRAAMAAAAAAAAAATSAGDADAEDMRSSSPSRTSSPRRRQQALAPPPPPMPRGATGGARLVASAPDGRSGAAQQTPRKQ
jgi:hypothetical protein